MSADMLRTIPALEAERDKLRTELAIRHERQHETEALAGQYLVQRDDVRAERDQLRAEVEALRADAERYRWLRSENQTVAGPCAYAPWMGPPMFSDELDSAIDAARNTAA